MDVKIFNNPDELALYCADIFTAQINEKNDSILGLATGASPLKMYAELVERCKKGEVSFRDVKTFNLDEYVGLPREDKNSYYSFMHDNLFDLVDIIPANTHLPDGNAADVEAHCAEYDKMIDEAGGIDLQLLGIGTNGHIGFNEPAEAFSGGTFRVELTQSTIDSNKIYFEDGKMPTSAITMGIGSILKAKKIVLIATGVKKAEAIKKLIMDDVTPSLPASALKNHKNSVILIDSDAASLL